jgi:hypothetical protein
VGPLILLGKAGDHRVEGWTSPAHTSIALGLGLAVVAFLTVAALVLGLTSTYRTASHSATLSQ